MLNPTLDWNDKLELFRLLLEVRTNKSLLHKVLGKTYSKDKIDALADNGYPGKWGTSRPTQAEGETFIRELANALPTRDTVIGELLLQLSLGEYIDKYLPDTPATKAALKSANRFRSQQRSAPTTPSRGTVTLEARDRSFYSMWFHDTGSVETIQSTIESTSKNKQIDQKHYYIDHDSANVWSGLVRADAYPTYKYCKAGLDALVKTDEWMKHIKASQISTTVMLAGGGAPTKDIVFIESLLEASPSGQIHHHLVDISQSMLRNSRRSIYENLMALGFRDRVHVEIYCCDILKPSGCMPRRFHDSGNVVFAITGGTIGNLNEEEFFGSLGSVTQAGDLLVIGADTIDEMTDDVRKSLEEGYINTDTRRFLRPVVKAVLSAANSRESVEDVLKKHIKFDLLEGTDSPSKIRGSCSVSLSMDIAGESIRLALSSRYQTSDLVAYAGERGWQSICTVPSPLSPPPHPQFKQFLFRRN